MCAAKCTTAARREERPARRAGPPAGARRSARGGGARHRIPLLYPIALVVLGSPLLSGDPSEGRYVNAPYTSECRYQSARRGWAGGAFACRAITRPGVIVSHNFAVASQNCPSPTSYYGDRRVRSRLADTLRKEINLVLQRSQRTTKNRTSP
ncbi:hypothetical protein EVAR_96640_1 [Eumeta japonica]|uniref:Uncharacterized protein n=1 Tax=Eumeta variegata TaxID=151549 RepID=A0A4C1WRS5_EUMVA|nr:hypothetical protein EVAR_96640_1 [Eumeta japonica]